MKRVNIFAGHYGSGKTNIAIAFAKKLASEGKKTVVCDLDIVNPYYRTKDSEEELKEYGIELLSSPFASSNVDLPALPSSFYRIVEEMDAYFILDVGGDDRGALALGRYAPQIKEENNYDMFYVVNFLRPLNRNAETAVEVMKEIELACNVGFTAIAQNTNLGVETTEDIIKKGYEEALKLSRLTGLPIAFNSVERSFASIDLPNVLPLALQKRPID